MFVGKQTRTIKINMMLAWLFLPLLLLAQVTVPVTSRLLSVQVTSYMRSRTTRNGPVRCALDTANQTSSSSSLQDCSLNCARDGTCIGFNMKNTLTCDHVVTPVLVSTSKIRSPARCTTTIRRLLQLSLAASFIRLLLLLILSGIVL